MDLIQPKHAYADDASQWHIYTNTSLRTIGALLAEKWVDICLHDENIRPTDSLSSNIVGMNLVGAPYIPVAMQTIKRLRKQFWDELVFVLWGQPLTQKENKYGKVLGLDEGQFKYLFWKGVYNGMKEWVVESLLNIKNISEWRTVSLISMYEKLSDSDFLDYFSRETSLYVSEGCKFNCDFCAAAKGQVEQYRDAEILWKDLKYIVNRLQKLWKNTVSMYMSNLDVFQSAQQLGGFANMILQIKACHPGFTFSLRALGCTKSFMRLDKKYPRVLERLALAGFNNVGYGVDGIGPEIWKWIKKPQNNEKDILDAIRLTKEKYNITPELLMVFGHAGIDTEKSLKDAYDFAEAMVQKYWAVPRPYVAKSFVPGNNGRVKSDFQESIKLMIENPVLFNNLEYSALASMITHPDDVFRNLVNEYYLKMCGLPENTTLPIIPYDIWDSEEILASKKRDNSGKFDR